MKLLLPVIILFSASLYAQNPLEPEQVSKPYYIGPVFGYNGVSHAGDREVIETTGSVPCPSFEDGSENGFYAGVAFEYLLGGAKNSTSSIIAKVLYSTMPAFVEKEGQELPANLSSAVDQGNTTPTQTLINFTNEISYSVLSVEALYKLNVAGTAFGVVAGVALDFTLEASETAQMELVSPENGRFIPSDDIPDGWGYPDPKTLRFGPEGGQDIEGAAGFRAGIKAGLQYEFNFTGFLIVPHIFYNYGLTDLVGDDNWSVSVFQIGTDIRFAF